MSQNSNDRTRDFEQDNLGISRRTMLRALLGAAASSVLVGLPASAHAAQATQETLDALSDAESQLADVEAQLEDLASQYEALSKKQNTTLNEIEDLQDKIDATQSQIDSTQDAIDKKQEELEARQKVLRERVSSSYKSGNADILTLLMASESFEDLLANSRYIDKINANDRAIIDEVTSIQADLKKQKEALEEYKSALQEQQDALIPLKEAQAKQLKEMQARQEEAAELINGLQGEVAELMEKRDAEIVAAAKAEAEAAAAAAAAAKAAEEAAAAAAAAAAKSGGSTGGQSGAKAGNVTGSEAQTSAATGSQAAVVNACQSTPSPGNGLCAAWVSNVFANAGIGSFGGNANDMYNSWCTSSNKDNLKVGMIVAVSTHAHTLMGSIYGHIGIYIGSGTMMDNIGYIRTISLDEWVNYYSTTVTPRWGWLGGVELQ